MSTPVVHHINAATMCPVSRRLVNGEGGLLEPARMVCHCFVVETDVGIVLVDTGFGLADIADPAGRLGRGFLSMTRPRLQPDEAVVRQLGALGLRAGDVRHILPTHLDLDHVGGLSDFPHAKVHVYEPEHRAAMQRATLFEKERYRTAQWSHGPDWQVHSRDGEDWFGFRGVRAIDGCDDVLIIPLEGHTRGHAGIAVRTAQGWLLHAGDAYFHHREISFDAPASTPVLSVFQRLMAFDDERRRANVQRLRALGHEHPDVRIVSAHCPVELHAAQERSRGADA